MKMNKSHNTSITLRHGCPTIITVLTMQYYLLASSTCKHAMHILVSVHDHHSWTHLPTNIIVSKNVFRKTLHSNSSRLVVLVVIQECLEF